MRNTALRITSSLLLASMVWLIVTEQCTSFTSTTVARIIRNSNSKVLRQSIGTMSERQNEQRLSSYVLVTGPSSSGGSNADTTKSMWWKELCPPIWNPKDTKDTTLMWSCCDDTQKVATQLMQRLSGDPTISWSSGKDPRIESVVQSLDQFRDFCMEHLRPSTNNNINNHEHGYMFKARIVATRGPVGTKCPQWHVDHVPVRWIQSMVGPGCEMVVGDNVNESINWNLLLNGLNSVEDEDQETILVKDSVQDRNLALVDDKLAKIYRAQPQEAVLLMGHRWADFSQDKDTARFIPPVVHKSPTIPWGSERVLLTQDIIFG